MHIFDKALDGGIHRLEVVPETTVAQIKARLGATDQILSFGSSILEEEQSLAALEIANGASLYQRQTPRRFAHFKDANIREPDGFGPYEADQPGTEAQQGPVLRERSVPVTKADKKAAEHATVEVDCMRKEQNMNF